MLILKAFNKKSIFILFLALVLTVNFSVKPVKLYADPITMTAIGLKVFALALGSMGVLAYVEKQEGSLEHFYNNFCDFYNSNSNANGDARRMFFDIFKNSIVNKTKLQFNNIKSDIKVFFNSTFLTVPDVPDIPDIPDVPTGFYVDNIIGSWSFFENGASLDIQNSYKANTTYNSDRNNQVLFDDFITDDFRIVAFAYQNLQNDFKKIYMDFYYKGAKVSNTKIVSPFTPCPSSNSDVISMNYGFSYNHEGAKISTVIRNHTTGITGSYVSYSPFDEYVFGKDYNPTIPDVIPNTLDIPNDGISFPFEKVGLDVRDYVGQTIDDLVNGLAGIPFADFRDRILGMPKVGIDSMPNTGVDVNEDGVITDVDVPDIPVVDDGVIGGDLTGITGLLQKILAFLQGIFEVPANAKIDFTPFKNIALSEKFPFSLPWDLSRMFNMLVAPPLPPRWEVPFLSEKIIIDFNKFEQLASISRGFSILMFSVGLIFSTKKLMGGS